MRTLLKLEDVVETGDGGADRHQDDHRGGGALVHVPQE
jgi:hypothetical protein